jgi:hypothetical protein
LTRYNPLSRFCLAAILESRPSTYIWGQLQDVLINTHHFDVYDPDPCTNYTCVSVPVTTAWWRDLRSVTKALRLYRVNGNWESLGPRDENILEAWSITRQLAETLVEAEWKFKQLSYEVSVLHRTANTSDSIYIHGPTPSPPRGEPGTMLSREVVQRRKEIGNVWEAVCRKVMDPGIDLGDFNTIIYKWVSDHEEKADNRTSFFHPLYPSITSPGPRRWFLFEFDSPPWQIHSMYAFTAFVEEERAEIERLQKPPKNRPVCINYAEGGVLVKRTKRQNFDRYFVPGAYPLSGASDATDGFDIEHDPYPVDCECEPDPTLFELYNTRWDRLDPHDPDVPFPSPTFTLDDLYSRKALLDLDPYGPRYHSLQVVGLNAAFFIGSAFNVTLGVEQNRGLPVLVLRGRAAREHGAWVDLLRFLKTVELPRWHPDRLSRRTRVPGKVDERIGMKKEFVAVREAVQALVGVLESVLGV